MHFKRVEIFGFKSFADKTKLEFGEGVTIIVGPNGCGKSNVSDAIRWATGEQSAKQLRGARMEDVIFSGTDSRPALNIAEVSVVLSNECRSLPIEYDEVVITRRIHRSGDSEYLINKNTVRLKDITELLAGTGIGVESYSVLEQGRIDQILSSKPEERRAIFEEASGISKFKVKKREAIRKLEATQSNLLRVSDIIQEVKRQIKSIERQARKAEKYKKIYNELKDLEVKKAKYEYMALTQDQTVSASEVEKLKLRQSDVNDKIKKARELIGQKESDLTALAETLQRLNKETLAKASEIDKKKHTLLVNADRKKETEGIIARLKEEIPQAEQTVRNLSDEIEKIRHKLDEENEKRTSQNELTLKSQSSLSSAQTALAREQERLNEQHLKRQALRDESEKLAGDLIRLRSDRENKTARIEHLKREKEQIENDTRSIEARIADCQEDVAKKEADKAFKEKDLLSEQDKLAEKKASVKQAEEEYKSKENSLLQLQSKMAMLDDLIKKRDGLAEGIRRLLEDFDSGKVTREGFCGLLCDLIRVKEGYEVVAEDILGDDLQSLVVEDNASLEQVFSHIKENGLGKINVISLEAARDSLKNASNKLKVNQNTQNIQAFRDYVSSDEKFSSVIDMLLTGVYVGRGAQESAVFDEDPTSLLVDGDLEIKRSFARKTLKDQNKDSTIINRKAHRDQLKNEIVSLEEDIAKLRDGLVGLRQEEQVLEDKIDETRRELHCLQIELAQTVSKKDGTDKEASWVKREGKIIDKECSDIALILEEIAQAETKITAREESIKEESRKIDEVIELARNACEKQAREREEILIQSTELRSVLDHIQGRIDHFNEHFKRTEGFLNDQKRDIVLKQNQLAESDLRIEELKEESKRIAEEIEVIAKDVDQTEGDLRQKHLLRDQIISENNRLKDDLAQFENMLSAMKDQQHDIDIRGNQITYERNAIRERIQQIYKTDLDEVEISFEDDFNIESIKPPIEELTQKLDKMGVVNLVAIEEHKELEERFTFLTTQYDDLVNAKEALQKTIRKINATTKDLFLETFAKVQKEFKNYFRSLFGGGQADVILTDEGDVLESGIDILARPPGKKLQRISLLSGGERSLTAIALLFAVFKSKPSPFCILDELDAPLDESNIDRFSRVLSEFVKMSQFIMISHNKRTIQLADMIYGVTMEEKGISKIVSVRFDNRDTTKADDLLVEA